MVPVAQVPERTEEAALSTADGPPLLVLAGATATGKSELALALCAGGRGEIVCADSAVVYRGLDVGTAKATAAERAAVVHHLVDVRNPEETFSVAEYRQLAEEAIRAAVRRGTAAVLTGGTGLYIRQVLDAPRLPPVPAQPEIRAALGRRPRESLHAELSIVDPAAAARIHPSNVRRVIRALEVLEVTGRPISEQWAASAPSRRPACFVVLDRPREVLLRRIARRVDRMLADGLVAEVRGLLASGVSPAAQSMQALGYRQTVRHLSGAGTLAQLRAEIITATAQYAKRQRTWFRREPATVWIDLGDDPAVAVLDQLRRIWLGTG